MVTITTAKAVEGFRNETGGHRIQRIPPTEKRGRVHTSTVTVFVAFDAAQQTTYDQRSETDFGFRWHRGTGNGGQKKNKVANSLEITHIPTGLTQVCNGRSREANEREAMAMLIERLDHLKAEHDRQSLNSVRNSQIGSGMRGDKRRTYRFRDDVVEDHFTTRRTSCKKFMRGQIDELWE